MEEVIISPNSLPGQLSNKSKEKIKALISEHKEEEKEDFTSRKVDGELCKDMREMFEDGMTYPEILEKVPITSADTLSYHITDKCTHEARTRLTYSECGWMRVKAHKGAPHSTLSILYDLHKSVVLKHLAGECSHEDGIDPLTIDRILKNEKEQVYRTKSVCDECGSVFKHRRWKDRRFCSKECSANYGRKVMHDKVNEDG